MYIFKHYLIFFHFLYINKSMYKIRMLVSLSYKDMSVFWLGLAYTIEFGIHTIFTCFWNRKVGYNSSCWNKTKIIFLMFFKSKPPYPVNMDTVLYLNRKGFWFFWVFFSRSFKHPTTYSALGCTNIVLAS